MNPFAHLQESLSASRVKTFLACPLRYYLRYVEHRPEERVGSALLLGIAVDQAMKQAVHAAKEGRDSVTPEEYFIEAFEKVAEGAKAPIKWPARYDHKGTLDLGQRLVEALTDVLLTEERLQRIVAWDVPFTVPLLDEQGQPEIPTPIVGIFDFVEEHEGGLVPLELKTASNRTQYLPDHLRRDVQASIYAMAATTMGSTKEPRVRYVSAVKLKKPEVIESENRCTPDQLRWIRGVIAGVDRAIRTGEFVARPSTIECGGCPYESACAGSGGCARVGSKSIFTAA
jgi:CRISPR/Cas system-associated exonuclease Cas4 (RecB family)